MRKQQLFCYLFHNNLLKTIWNLGACAFCSRVRGWTFHHLAQGKQTVWTSRKNNHPDAEGSLQGIIVSYGPLLWSHASPCLPPMAPFFHHRKCKMPVPSFSYCLTQSPQFLPHTFVLPPAHATTDAWKELHANTNKATLPSFQSLSNSLLQSLQKNTLTRLLVYYDFSLSCCPVSSQC